MKTFISKKNCKNLIIIITIIFVLCGLFPKNIQAKTDTEEGGGLLLPIEKLVVYVCDIVMQWMQDIFTTTETIYQGGTYKFQYSPAIIFSGTVQAFDINFIKPNKDIRNQANYSSYIRNKQQEYFNSTKRTTEEDFRNKLDAARKRSNKGVLRDPLRQISSFDEFLDTGPVGGYIQQEIIYYEENNKFNIEIFRATEWALALEQYYYNKEVIDINEDFKAEVKEVSTYKSIAGELQSTIATWYNALRRIALVGLLSVLVYVGIRIILTSSASDKAKYKEMLKDWLVAICLLFTLHYIMNITITVVNEISDIFSTGETDVLLNDLRFEIYAGTWGTVLAKVIMYTVLVIFTVTYTFQYLKRVIYIAFYTLIAPLITLTYPLDKIKDGQAQAFNMWIKEYLFTALTQVVHLVIYFVLVSSALEMVTDYPLYAILVIAFIKKAEDLIKKMFGFEKSETVGILGAAATGGLVMNALNQVKNLGGSKGGANDGAAGGSASNNVRTASKNPLDALNGGANNPGGANTPRGANPPRGANTPGGANTPSGANSPVGANPPSGANSANNTRTINGFKKGMGALRKKYTKPAARAVAGIIAGGVGAIGAGAGAIASGNLAAVPGAIIAGASKGKNLGKGVVDFTTGIPGNIKDSFNNVRDTWNTGVYGEETAQNIKFDREFRNSSTYKSLSQKYGDQFSDDSVQSMLDAGITDKNAMDKILGNLNGNQYSNIDEAIGYYSLAQKCPDSLYYDDQKLEKWLITQGLSQSDAKKMREKMNNFK